MQLITDKLKIPKKIAHINNISGRTIEILCGKYIEGKKLPYELLKSIKKLIFLILGIGKTI